MANKKILYTDSTGIIKELPSGSGVTASYYDDAGNGVLFAKNITFNTMSFKNDGLLVVNNGTASVLTKSDGSTIKNYDVVSWDTGSGGRWKYINGTLIDVTGAIPGGSGQLYTASANADISGTFNEPKIKNLSNVITGVLAVQNGGTGLGFESGRNDFSGLTGEYILTASSTGKFGFLTASQATSAVALVSNGTSWEYITQSVNNNVEVQVFTANDVWNKPDGTKAIRVLAQGAGGGGGSGGNRNNLFAALGGTGGSAGAFVDTGIVLIDNSLTAVPVTVGSGGLGANYVQTNSAGANGTGGGSSSFGQYCYANGGNGGVGGNINSSTTSSGGASVTASSFMYDIFVYNKDKILNTSAAGLANTTTTGKGTIFNPGYYYGANPGSSGGSLTAYNYTTANSGGNVQPIEEYTSSFLLKFDTGPSVSDICGNFSPSIISGSGLSVEDVPSLYGNNLKAIKTLAGTGFLTYIKPGGNFSSNDFTYEVWVYYTAYATTYSSILSSDNTGDTHMRIFITNLGKISVFNTTAPLFESTNAVPLNSWTHIAVSREGNKWYIFINGVKEEFINNDTILFTLKSNTRIIAPQGTNAGDQYKALGGLYADFRATNKAIYKDNFYPTLAKPLQISGSAANLIMPVEANVLSNNAVYTSPSGIYIGAGGGGGASAAVTQPTGNVAFLATFNTGFNILKDESIYNRPLISSGGVPPYYYTSSISSPVGLPGSGMTDGVLSSSYSASALTITQLLANQYAPCFISGTFSIPANQSFTMEGWYYLENTGSNTWSVSGTNLKSTLMYFGYDNSHDGYFININSNRQLCGQFKNGSGTTTVLSGSNGLTPPLKQWFHVALTRISSSTSMTLYMNGTSSNAFGGFGAAQGCAGPFSAIGSLAPYTFNGYAKDCRVILSASSQQDIQARVNAVLGGASTYSVAPLDSYSGGLGGNGAWGSGGGGGGASTNLTGSLVGTRQGGNGGDGYVAVISYKY